MILYIAGPMTGIEDFNRPAFYHAQLQLIEAGFATINPADHVAESWEGFMRLGIAAVCRADGIALLPGWETSRGALLEVTVGNALRLPKCLVSTWLTRADPHS